ncbi:glycosyltransferase [Cetobacterium somerae]|uniref:glycosyltransferase n=1 Tax=Cetobacterium sp. NK01 TaxID=2993530 RepID=UPI0021171399|nr:glycosyltransferase [Cetobacterium sp. NK01]MCQ8212094.1 glycosyltransferase [Cetobacterium sp. NK01]
MKKKIGICTGNISVGGQEKMLIEFLKVLSPEKYDLELFIEENKGEKNFFQKDIPNYVNYRFLTSKSIMNRIEKNKSSKNPLRKLLYSIDLIRKKEIAIRKLSRLVEDKEIIIDYNLGLLRKIDRLDLENKKVVGWSHAGEGGVLKNKRKHRNMAKYNSIVSVNNEMKKGYEKNYSHLNIKMKTIENFIDEKNILKLSEESIEEKNLGQYILSVGSLTENKNFLALIKGYKKFLDKSESTLNLVIIGDGKEKDNLERTIKRLNLEDRVFLLGSKGNPYPYIKSCEYYVQSSKAESFSLVLAEAMVFGKVVISKENIGSKRVLNNGENGILIKSVERDLEKILLKLIRDRGFKSMYEKKSKEGGKEFFRGPAKERIEEFIDSL